MKIIIMRFSQGKHFKRYRRRDEENNLILISIILSFRTYKFSFSIKLGISQLFQTFFETCDVDIMSYILMKKEQK